MDDEIEIAIAAFLEAQQRLMALTDGKTDSIVGSAGQVFLLPPAQMHYIAGEAEQRWLAELQKAIFDALPANIALLDRAGTVAAVNRGWREFAAGNGYAGSDCGIGESYLAVCERATGEEAAEAMLAADGIRSVLDGRAEGFASEYPCHAPDETRWFQVIAAPMPAASGFGAIVLHVDVTRAKCAENQAQEFGRRLETLVQQANIGILVHSDFKPLLANAALARILGYPDRDAILALPDCHVLFAAEESERISGYYARRLSGDAPELYQVKGRRADGLPVELENRAFPIQWGDQPAACAMLTDITARRNTEMQLLRSQRLEAVGQLTGGIAHDLNNLLQVVLGNTELLEDALAHDSNLRAAVQDTKSAAERGAELVHRMLAFARRQPLSSRASDVNRLVSDMGSLLRRALGRSVDIELRLDAGLWTALIDPSQLESAIMNLCLNARDAMPRGGKLRISTSNASFDDTQSFDDPEFRPGKYVAVAVSDEGEGMDANTLRQVFEPFFTTKEVGKGSGLGLSMVYGFVKQSDGHVRIQSKPGLGTTVKLYLPRVAGKPERPAASLKVPPARGTEKILMVEDDEFVREHVLEQLRNLGYAVIAAGNGLEAMALLRQNGDFDLLFTDLLLPGGMDGLQLATEAQRLRPGLRVLYTSGDTDNVLVDAGGPLDGIELLSKPYRKRELALRLRRILDDGRPRAAASL